MRPRRRFWTFDDEEVFRFDSDGWLLVFGLVWVCCVGFLAIGGGCGDFSSDFSFFAAGEGGFEFSRSGWVGLD